MNQAIKVLPWGEEVYLEIPLHKAGSIDRFYARHGKTEDGREYIEFSKFGPKPNTENEIYTQKLRIYDQEEWKQIQSLVNGELGDSIHWNN